MKIIWFLFLSFCFCSFEEYDPPSWDEITDETNTFEEHRKSYGDCICDLTENQCDFNCACDEDCSETERQQFYGTLKQMYSRDFLQIHCTETTTVFANLPSSISSYDRDSVFPGICVVYETNPSLGLYYSVVDDVTALTTFEEIESRAELVKFKPAESFIDNYELTNEILDVDTSLSWYRVGDYLLLKTLSGSSLDDTDFDYLSLPAGVLLDGECCDNNFVEFMINRENTCFREFEDETDFSNYCTGGTILDANSYFSGLYVGKKSSADIVGEFVEIELYSVNGNTGATSVSAPNWNSGVCENVVKEIIYKIEYNDDNGLIQNVNVEIETEDVDYSTNGNFYFQTFSVQFTLNYTTTEIIPRSGNPGYLSGSRILHGRGYNITQDGETQEVVARYKEGITVLKGLKCTDMNEEEILFGKNQITSCRLDLTEAELQTLCETDLDDYKVALSQTEYIGKYGNSQMENINHWVRVVHINREETAQWNSGNSTCLSIPSIINIEFIVARSGSIRNQQMKIVGVKKEYKNENWSFLETKGNANSFYIKWNVKFTEHVKIANYPMVSPVRHLIEIPGNWFYPLKLLLIGGTNQNYFSVIILSFVVLILL